MCADIEWLVGSLGTKVVVGHITTQLGVYGLWRQLIITLWVHQFISIELLSPRHDARPD